MSSFSQTDILLTAEERFQAAKERGSLAMKSKCSAELTRLLKEGPFGKTRQGQIAWWERMAELFEMRGMELTDAGFPSFGQEMGSVAEYHRERGKEMGNQRGPWRSAK